MAAAFVVQLSTEAQVKPALTALNIVLALVPTALIAVRQTTTINASMTAYSTAVGPSSEPRNRTMLRAMFFTVWPLCVVMSLYGIFVFLPV
jgi:hypothetical protein